MTFPESFGPGEEASDKEIEEWLEKMVRRRLLIKRYEILDGTGQWTYKNSRLSTYLVLPLHSFLTRLHLIGPGQLLPIVPGFQRRKKP